ncbi:MAG: hypothetical protein R6X27_15870 [Candidatus Desulfacyla sp.]
MEKLIGFVLAVLLSGVMVWFAQKNGAIPDAQKFEPIVGDFEDYARNAMDAWRIPGMA